MNVSTDTKPPLSDEALIARILNGEKRLFELLMRKYNQRLYRIGMSVLADETETEDAMQTAYINAYEHLSGFEYRSSFSTWLTRIMLNQCYKQKRETGQPRGDFGQQDNFIHMETPANELANKELCAVLEQAITRLPEKYRLVFMMREIEDMTVRDTSMALNIEETNVKVRLNRAKTMLRKNLSSYMKDNVYDFHLSRCDSIVSRVMQHIGIS